MIDYIVVNLLPYREREQAEKKKKFIILMSVFTTIGIISSILIYIILNSMIYNQEKRNSFLNNKIFPFHNELKVLKELTDKKNKILMKKEKIELLEYDRYIVTMLLNDFNQIIPSGIQLTSITPVLNEQYKYIITGKALSDSKVSLLMKSLSSTGLVLSSELIEIITKNNKQEFKLLINLSK